MVIMDILKTIQILLVENKESGLLLEDLLKDFSLKAKTEVIVFENEDKLMDYIKEFKSDEKSLNDPFSNIIIFNLYSNLDKAIEVIKKIKSDPYSKIIPIFMVTSSIDEKEIKEVYNAHVNSYIVKPEDLEGLINIVNRFKDYWNQVLLP